MYYIYYYLLYYFIFIILYILYYLLLLYYILHYLFMYPTKNHSLWKHAAEYIEEYVSMENFIHLN